MRQFIVSVDEVDHAFATSADLEPFLADLESKDSVDLFVTIDLGPSKKWTRFLGGPKRDFLPCFGLRTAAHWACLTFLDDSGSEYRAIDADQDAVPGAKALETLADDGEPVEPKECLLAARAFRAIREYLNENCQRPSWLMSRYVE